LSAKKHRRRTKPREAGRPAEATGSGRPDPGAALFGETPDHYWVMVAVCLGVGALFRLIYLAADPPWDFTWSQALFTDGARAIDGARSKMVFGAWIVDMRSPVVLFYPLVNLIAFVVFRVGGVGLAQANLVGVLPALGTLILAFGAMRRAEGRLGGLVLLVALAFSYVHVVYSRVPMVESLLVFMLLAAFWLLLRGGLGVLLSGLVVGSAALMVKMHALHVVPVAILFFVMGREPEGGGRRVGRNILYFTAGLAVAAVVWAVTIYPVNPEIVSKYFRSNVVLSQQGDYAAASLVEILGRRVGAFIHIGSGRDGLFAEMPFLSIAAFLGLICVISGFGSKDSTSKPWERLAAIWFVGIAAALSLLSYRPLRYMVLLIPGSALLATAFMLRLARGGGLLSARKPRWFGYAFAIWLAWALIHLQQDLIFRALSGGASMITGGLTEAQMPIYRFQAAVWSKVLVFGAVAVGLTLAIHKRLPAARLRLPRRLRIASLAILIAGIVVFNTFRFVQFARNRKYSIVDGAHSLERVLSDGVFLVGDCATTMSLETGFRTLPAYGDLIRYDERAEFGRYPITHFILRFPTLYEYLTKNYPGFESGVKIVRSFALCGRDATIVRYEGWPSYGGSGYRPSRYEIAMADLAAGDLDQAAAGLEAFLAEHTDSHEALVGLAICWVQTGQAEAAIEAMERAIVLNPRDALSYEIYGDILGSLGRDLDARSQWRKALKLNPNSRKLMNKLSSRRR
jgi:hypothetical protein